MELTLLSLQCLARKKMIVSFLQILLHIRCHIVHSVRKSYVFPLMNDLVINFVKLISRKNCFDFFSGQTLVLIQTVAKWKWWSLFSNEIPWYYLEDLVLATFWSIIWRFDAKSENPKGPVLVAFDKYCQMLHLLIFCQNLTPHMLSTSHNDLKSQKNYEI